MYSKQKDDGPGIQRNSLSLILLTILLIIMAEATTSSQIKNQKGEIHCGSFDYEANETSNKSENEIYLVSSSKKINNEVNSNRNLTKSIDSINKNIDGFTIIVDNNLFGYVLSQNQKDKMIKNLCETYLRELDISLEDVTNIKLNGKIEATPYQIQLSELSNSNEISKDLYEASVFNNNISNLSLNVNNTSVEVIEPQVIIENDESLYIGEENIVEGEKGLKTVYKDIYYEGLSIIEERVLEESILVEPVATVVYKGTKNPYYDGVKFLTRPLSGGYISSYFGEDRGNSYHKGLDIAENFGEEIVASFDGEVVFAGYNDGGYGNLVILQHSGDMETYYAHMNEIYVSAGEYVKEGDTIGVVGSTGYSTGPHLHFELRVDNKPINPLNYIDEK